MGQQHQRCSEIYGRFFEDSAAGSVQRYVENFTEQLRSANTKLLKANESLSRIDESRLRLIRTVSHELANVLNTLKLTITLVTTGNDEAIRSEMLGICQRNVQEMSELLNDLKDYSVLIAGAASLQIEEINVRVFGSELEASFPCNDAGCRHASRFADRSRSERCTQRSKKDSADHYKPGNKRNKLLPERQTQYDGRARVPIVGSGFLADRCRIRRTTQEWSSFCETMEGHRRQAMQSKRWSTGLFVFSEVFFLVASLSLAMSLG